jgi:hypothetical protein
MNERTPTAARCKGLGATDHGHYVQGRPLQQVRGMGGVGP